MPIFLLRKSKHEAVAARLAAQGLSQQQLLDYYHQAIQGGKNDEIAGAHKAYHDAYGADPKPPAGLDGAAKTRVWRAAKTFNLGKPPTVVNAGARGGAGAKITPGLPKAPKAPGAPKATTPAGIPRPSAGFLDLKDHKVQHPGIRGGKGYWDQHGVWQYGEPPKGHIGHSAPPDNLTKKTKGHFDSYGQFIDGRSSGYNRDIAMAGKPHVYYGVSGGVPGGWYDAYGFLHMHPKAPPHETPPDVIPDATWRASAPAGYDQRSKGHFNDAGLFDPQGVKRRPDLAGQHDIIDGVPAWYDEHGFAHFHEQEYDTPLHNPHVCTGCGKTLTDDEKRWSEALGMSFDYCRPCLIQPRAGLIVNTDTRAMTDKQFDSFVYARAAEQLVNSSNWSMTGTNDPLAFRLAVMDAMRAAGKTYARPSKTFPAASRDTDGLTAALLATFARGGFISSLGNELVKAGIATHINDYYTKIYPDPDQKSAYVARELIRREMSHLQATFPAYRHVYAWDSKVQFELGAIHLQSYRDQCDDLIAKKEFTKLRDLQKHAGRVILHTTASQDYLRDRITNFYGYGSDQSVWSTLHPTEVASALDGLGTTVTPLDALQGLLTKAIAKARADWSIDDSAYAKSNPINALKDAEKLLDGVTALAGSFARISREATADLKKTIQTPEINDFLQANPDFAQNYLGGWTGGTTDPTKLEFQGINDPAFQHAYHLIEVRIKTLKKKAEAAIKDRVNADFSQMPQGHAATKWVEDHLNTLDLNKMPPRIGGKRTFRLASDAEKQDAQREVDLTSHDAHVKRTGRIVVEHVIHIDYDDPLFDKAAKEKGNIKTLYHGSKPDVAMSICLTGLHHADKAGAGAVTQQHGGMFGYGIYLAPQSTKSGNYSFGGWNPNSPPSAKDIGALYHVDAVLGKTRVATAQDMHDRWSKRDVEQWNQAHPNQAFDSLHAPSNMPHSGGRLMNDEVIVYSTSQAKVRRILLIRKVTK